MLDSSTNKKELLSYKVISALMTNDVDCLKRLREAGEELSLLDANGNSLLHLAVMDYSEREKSQRKFSSGHTNRAEAFDYLLTLEEIDKGSYNGEGKTPLEEICMYLQDSPEWAIELINSSRSVETHTSALHWAVYNDWPEVVELLIENGIDIDFLYIEGHTVLYLACKLGLVDLMWMLLFYGADPNKSDFFSSEPRCSATFLDLAFRGAFRDELQEMFPEMSPNCEKTVTLTTFLDAMEKSPDKFYQLYEIADDIENQTNKFVDHFHTMNPDLFKMFVQKYSWTLLDIIRGSWLNELVPHVCDKNQLDVFAANIFTLVESDIGRDVIELFSQVQGCHCQAPVECFSIYFSGHEDELTKFLFHLLSYGLELTSVLMNLIYELFGYCPLFKMLFHMDIEDVYNFAGIVPEIYYNMGLTPTGVIRHVRYNYRYNIHLHLLFGHFALPKLVKCSLEEYENYKKLVGQPGDYSYRSLVIPEMLHEDNERIPERLRTLPSVPKLQEFARNKAREYIISRYKTKNCQQFYTIVNWLPIAKIHKEILGYERKLYE